MAKVLSTTQMPPRSRVSAAIASMSTIVSRGLVGVSTSTSRVDGCQAAAIASRSVKSTTVCPTSMGLRILSTSRKVPP